MLFMLDFFAYADCRLTHIPFERQVLSPYHPTLVGSNHQNKSNVYAMCMPTVDKDIPLVHCLNQPS